MAEFIPAGYGYSDGEAPYDPLHVGYDTSDNITLSNLDAFGISWTQDANSHWTETGHEQWTIPATIPGCGSENEPSCEPVGRFTSNGFWVIPTPYHIGIWDPDGELSDVVSLYNDANGQAHIDFYSDPAVAPEPATWAMMGLGFAALAFVGYRSRKAQAIAA